MIKMAIVFVSAIGFTFNAFAHDDYKKVDVIHFDVPIQYGETIHCDTRFNKPSRNDFEIIGYQSMSSELGRRLVMLTIKNTANGQRILSENHLIAISADCKSRVPKQLKLKFSARETITSTIDFGYLQFPIVKLATSEDEL